LNSVSDKPRPKWFRDVDKPVEQFIQLPFRVFEDGRLSVEAKLTFAALRYCDRDHDDRVTIGYPAIGRIIGRSRDSAVRFIGELVEAGHIAKVGGRDGCSLTYILRPTHSTDATGRDSAEALGSDSTNSTRATGTHSTDAIPPMAPVPPNSISNSKIARKHDVDARELSKKDPKKEAALVFLRAMKIGSRLALGFVSVNVDLVLRWKEVDWFLDYPDIRNRASFLIHALREGLEPSENPQIGGNRSYLSATETSEDERSLLLAVYKVLLERNLATNDTNRFMQFIRENLGVAKRLLSLGYADSTPKFFWFALYRSRDENLERIRTLDELLNNWDRIAALIESEAA
jgi:hypothetical protein